MAFAIMVFGGFAGIGIIAGLVCFFTEGITGFSVDDLEDSTEFQETF